MNLPFSPTFFTKIDIYQQLVDFEQEKKIKNLWDGVKAVLLWSASIHHQHLGSSIGSNHVKDALKIAVSEGYLTEEDKNRMHNSAKHILESLPNYGFGEFIQTADPSNPSVRISRNGILAGRILKETNSLKSNWRYKIWTYLWWVVLVLAGLLLLAQTISAIKGLFLSNTNNKMTPKNIHIYEKHSRF